MTARRTCLCMLSSVIVLMSASAASDASTTYHDDAEGVRHYRRALPRCWRRAQICDRQVHVAGGRIQRRRACTGPGGHGGGALGHGAVEANDCQRAVAARDERERALRVDQRAIGMLTDW